jgi:hypothetical protein
MRANQGRRALAGVCKVPLGHWYRAWAHIAGQPDGVKEDQKTGAGQDLLPV